MLPQVKSRGRRKCGIKYGTAGLTGNCLGMSLKLNLLPIAGSTSLDVASRKRLSKPTIFSCKRLTMGAWSR
jgi:hypothetical protein